MVVSKADKNKTCIYSSYIIVSIRLQIYWFRVKIYAPNDGYLNNGDQKRIFKKMCLSVEIPGGLVGIMTGIYHTRKK